MQTLKVFKRKVIAEQASMDAVMMSIMPKDSNAPSLMSKEK